MCSGAIGDTNGVGQDTTCVLAADSTSTDESGCGFCTAGTAPCKVDVCQIPCDGTLQFCLITPSGTGDLEGTSFCGSCPADAGTDAEAGADAAADVGAADAGDAGPPPMPPPDLMFFWSATTPVAIAADERLGVFVGSSDGQITRYSTTGTRLNSFASQVQNPDTMALSLSSAGKLFVADRGGHRIEIFSAETGSLESSFDTESAPVAVASATTPDQIYVITDDGALREYAPCGDMISFVFLPQDSGGSGDSSASGGSGGSSGFGGSGGLGGSGGSGASGGSIGSGGSVDGGGSTGISSAVALGVSPTGDAIYVVMAQPTGGTVDRFNSDLQQVASWSIASAFGSVGSPVQVTDAEADAAGDVFVSDQHSIRAFSRDGAFETVVGTSGEFDTLRAISIDATGSLYTADSGRSVVGLFRAPPPVANSAAVVVPAGTTQTLAAGEYGAITVQSKARLQLSGGTYKIGSISLAEKAHVEAMAPTELRVATRLAAADKSVVLRPGVGTGLTAGDLRIAVLGGDGAVNDPSALAAQIGAGSDVTAFMFVPNGTLAIGDSSFASGQFVALRKQFAQTVKLQLVGNIADWLPTFIDPPLGCPSTCSGMNTECETFYDPACGLLVGTVSAPYGGESCIVLSMQPDQTACTGGRCCSGVCTPIREAGGTCAIDADCVSGLVCGQNNGARFGLSPDADVCWNPLCADGARFVGCGYQGAPCGILCSDAKPCTSDADCPTGDVCGQNNGARLGSLAFNVCWPAGCQTDPVATGCGTFSSPCGLCICQRNCAGKTCGDASDGCGGECGAICADRQAGCTSDYQCQPGSTCVIGGGPLIGLPEGTNVCLPARCTEGELKPPDCGDTSAPCGKCPDCVPDCTGRQCGPDPRCGTECGGPCADGYFCNATGQCALFVPISPVLVPDGTGSFRSVGPITPATTETPGALQGTFAVTDRGSASYTIPIAVPPGRLGVQPVLSIRYTSSTGNGTLGMGWSLDGLSTITRCPQTVAQDGKVRGVRMDAGDRFCLDGQRLVALTNETYGADGTEYRTEIETFARVVSHGGSPDAGPAFFEVRTRDGRILEYGNSTSSAFVVAAQPYAWAVDRVSDRSGNSMTIEYQSLQSLPAFSFAANSASTLEPLPSAITYTEAPGVPGDRAVRFVYEDRTDQMFGWAPGKIPQWRTKRLSRIETYAQNKQVLAYHLGYENPGNVDAPSMLQTIQECAVDDSAEMCKPATTFEYENIDTGFADPVRGGFPFVFGAFFDHNNDAHDDMAVVNALLSYQWHPVFNETEAQLISVGADVGAENPLAGVGATAAMALLNYFLSDTDVSVQYRRMTLEGETCNQPFKNVGSRTIGCDGAEAAVDLNGDGNQELIDVCAVPTATVGPGGHPQISLEKTWYYDLNGDGRTDVVGCDNGGFLRGALSNGSNFGASFQLPFFGSTCYATTVRPPSIVTDFDGDGAPNLLLYDPQLGWGALTTDPFAWQTGILPTESNPNDLMLQLADINGDGLLDIVHLRHGDPRFADVPSIRWVNQGGVFSPAGIEGDEPDINYVPWTVDVDHDGKDEIVHASKAQNGWIVRHFATDSSTFIRNVQGVSTAAPGFLADVNGDGTPDLVTSDMTENPFMNVQCGISSGNNLLTGIRNGLGHGIGIRYESTEDGQPTYTQGEFCAWPERCLPRVTSALVSSHFEGSLDNGTRRRFVYQYSDAKSDVAGRDWVGFGQRTITEYGGSGAKRSTTTINYDNFTVQNLDGSTGPISVGVPYFYPFAGLPLEVKTETLRERSPIDLPGSSTTKRDTVIDYGWQLGSSTAGGGRPFPILSARTTGVFDDDEPLYSEGEGFLFDSLGNVLAYGRIGDGTLQVNTDYYPPDFDNWLLALPHTSTVTSTRNQYTETRNTSYTFTPEGLLDTVTREPTDSYYTRTTKLFRDAFGNVNDVTQTGNNSDTGTVVRETQIGYDAQGLFPASVTNALGQTTQVRYDDRHGALIMTGDPNGIVERMSYDGFGRLRSADGPWGSATVDYESVEPRVGTIVPNGMGVLSRIRSVTRIAAGPEVIEELDAYLAPTRRATSGFDGVTVEQELEYDLDGHLHRVARPHLVADTSQGIVQFGYDNWDRLIQADYPDGARVSMNHASRITLSFDRTWLKQEGSAEVEVVQSIDALGHSNVVVSDRYGAPLSNTDALGNASEYVYGAFDELYQVRDAADNITNILPDRYGRTGILVDPALGVQGYTYTAFDELNTAVDGNGRQSTYVHDKLSRLLSVADSDGTTTFSYDGAQSGQNAIGRLVQSVSPTGQTTQYEYEPPTATQNRGLLSAVHRTIAGEEFTSRFEYDAASRPSVVHYPDAAGRSFAVRYGYDGVGNLATVTNADTSEVYWQMLEADQGIRIKKEHFSNGAETVREYKPLNGELQHLTTTVGTSAVQDLSYEYDLNGNVVARQDNLHGAPESFFYDSLDRLNIHVGEFGYQILIYDALGNILSNTTNDAATNVGTYTYDAAHPYQVVTAGDNEYAYDFAGNVLHRSGPSVPGGDQVFGYTAFYLPRAILTGNADLTTFGYDADQTRVFKETAELGDGVGTLVRYAGEGYRRVEPNGPNGGNASHIYRVFAAGRAIAEIRRDASGSTDVARFLHDDLLGSTQTTTAPTGDSDWQDYSAFGIPSGGPLSGEQPEFSGFTGHEEDRDLGLINMRGRMFDATLARFTTPDPFVQAPFWTQGLNRYAYAFNNPLGYVDPSGFEIEGTPPSESGAGTQALFWGAAGVTTAGVGVSLYLLSGSSSSEAVGGGAASAAAASGGTAGFTATFASALAGAVPLAAGATANIVTISQLPIFHTQNLGSQVVHVNSRAMTSAGGGLGIGIGIVKHGPVPWSLTSESAPAEAKTGPRGEFGTVSPNQQLANPVRWVVSIAKLIARIGEKFGWPKTLPGSGPAPAAGVRASEPSPPPPAAARGARELLEPGGSRIGTAGASGSIRILQGGERAARELFERLAAGGTPYTGAYAGEAVSLPGGGFVGLRTTATSTIAREVPAATIDVNIPGIMIRELKFLP